MKAAIVTLLCSAMLIATPTFAAKLPAKMAKKVESEYRYFTAGYDAQRNFSGETARLAGFRADIEGTFKYLRSGDYKKARKFLDRAEKKVVYLRNPMLEGSVSSLDRLLITVE